jgi:hypothetical protein
MRIPQELKPALWGALGGAIVLSIVGFSWGGWTTSGTAATAAERGADKAVISALSEICVFQFKAGADATAKLAALKAGPGYNRDTFITEGGWATMPGSDKPVPGVAQACGDKLAT